ncbi:4a-hydroxytetrahydrobiopterin dehydratase [Zhihengliuella salsuginis]|uniref:Putative pterin-4-alpha-carbinolamine dehydratase n=1 Tax=Zhihengliuella salsuginis TaxID=578222 RepID=A0ABQ3GGW8_9MICC|nr:4a-hydroxytetrahydrobiopterin dehydratase [Zhihengliuella salsuginis]GHD05639.1 4a-hydroxytetrahydrobiopterin dehydratase [Zhihengliuella salsuginis]
MTDPKQKLSPSEIAEAGLAGWRLADETLTAHFQTQDFATGLDLVNRIGGSAEEANHHPDITLTYPEVGVTLSSHDVGGITSRDVDLARIISGHAEDLGVEAATE